MRITDKIFPIRMARKIAALEGWYVVGYDNVRNNVPLLDRKSPEPGTVEYQAYRQGVRDAINNRPRDWKQ